MATRVEVKSSCVVKMAGVSPTPISRLDLTPLDHQQLHIGYIQRGLIFHNPKNDSNNLQILENLKHSLSLSLDFFPPLAGRLSPSLHSVDCNDAGVEFTHATAAAISISDIIEPNYTPQFVSSSFFPLNATTNHQGVSQPLLAVQVTELADGLFIACAANHAVVDGTSFWHFLNSWSQISRGSDKISKPPLFHRCDAPPLPPLEQNPRRNVVQPPPPVVSKFLHFSRECLSKLKGKANSEAGTENISSLQSLSAHLWRTTMRCRRRSPSSEEEAATFITLVGARGRNPNLADGYFGNAVYTARTTVSVAELLQKGLGYAALKINELVARQTREEAAIKFEKLDYEENPTTLFAGVVPPFIVTSSPRFDVYGNDFGWGKPIGVRSGRAQQYDGMVIVFPAADGGIDVELCLEPNTFEAMEDDADFTQDFNVN